MTYLDPLCPWCIIQFLPNMRWFVVARFCQRNDAEGYLKILHRLAPNYVFAVVFDPGLAQQEQSAFQAANADL